MPLHAGPTRTSNRHRRTLHPNVYTKRYANNRMPARKRPSSELRRPNYKETVWGNGKLTRTKPRVDDVAAEPARNVLILKRKILHDPLFLLLRDNAPPPQCYPKTTIELTNIWLITILLMTYLNACTPTKSPPLPVFVQPVPHCTE